MFKKIKEKFQEVRLIDTKSLKVGGYSVTLTLLVIALIVAGNILVRSLPASWMKLDVTSNQLYSISYSTKKILQNVNEDVTIYLVTQEDEEDETLSILLERYDSLSEHIELKRKDPDVYPNFLDGYGVSTVTNNTVVVECGDKYRTISYSDLYETDSSGNSTAFAGESEVTSAIQYVVLEELPKLAMLEGHGEDTLSDATLKAIEKENIETESISLIEESEVSEDIEILLINNPDSDISEIELEAIEDYLLNGGNLVVIRELKEEDVDFTNLDTLMEENGVTVEEGIVLEASSSNYAWNMPYYLLANLNSHEITDPLKEENYYVMLPVAQGLSTDEDVTVLLETSSLAYSKTAGYDITTYEKEEGDIDGPFALATLSENGDSKAIFISSASIVDDTVNSYVSGGNRNFFLNCLNYMAGNEESIAIRAKTTEYNYLTMDTTTSNTLSLIFIAVVPLTVLLTGIIHSFRRRKKA